jgi:hypothetical protein
MKITAKIFHGPFGAHLPQLLVPTINSCERKLWKTKKLSYKRLFVISWQGKKFMWEIICNPCQLVLLIWHERLLILAVLRYADNETLLNQNMKCEYSWFNETEESCVVVMCHSCLLVGKDSSFSITLWQTIRLKKLNFMYQSESTI